MAQLDPRPPCYVDQLLKIEVPESLMTRILYAEEEITTGRGFRGAGIDVKYPSGSLAGALIFYPGVSVESLGK